MHRGTPSQPSHIRDLAADGIGGRRARVAPSGGPTILFRTTGLTGAVTGIAVVARVLLVSFDSTTLLL